MNQSKLRPLHDQILFRFEEKIVTDSNGTRMFETKSNAGIVVMGNIEDSTKAAKWGKVIAIGNSVTEVSVGDRILIEPLMWTEGVKLDDEDMFWKTDETKIIGLG